MSSILGPKRHLFAQPDYCFQMMLKIRQLVSSSHSVIPFRDSPSPALQEGTVPSEDKTRHLTWADWITSCFGFWSWYAACFSCLHSSLPFKLPRSSFTPLVHAGHLITPDFRNKEEEVCPVITLRLHTKDGSWVRRDFRKLKGLGERIPTQPFTQASAYLLP